jgi:hypothetical protein
LGEEEEEEENLSCVSCGCRSGWIVP